MKARKPVVVGFGVALVLGLALLGSRLSAARPSAALESAGPDREIDRVRSLFPQTEGWFRIVATAEFSTGPSGRIVPDYSTLTHQRVRWSDASGHTIAAQFAPTFRNATRILSGEDQDAWIDVLPEHGQNVEAELQDGLVVYGDAYRDTDVLYKSTPTHTDEYLLLRTPDAPTRWTYRVRMGPRIARLRQGGSAVEAVDARGVPWMRANAPFAVDQEGTRVDGRIRIEGERLIAEIDTSGLTYPVLVDPDWRSTGDMSHGRFYMGLNELPDGRLLATGGCSASICSGDLSLPACRTVVSAGEALDLDTRTWSRVGDANLRAFFHVHSPLPDGSILIAGGCANPDCSAITLLSDIWDVSMNAFRSVPDLTTAQAGMVSAILPGGRVLAAGGCDFASCSTDAAAFDPDSETWSALAPMNSPRGRSAVTVLSDGRVLAAGGCTTILCDATLASAEVYDPALDQWDPVGDMSTVRGGHWSSRLLDGRVLIGGGCSDQSCTNVLASAEIFDPRTGEFTSTGAQVQPRVGAVAVALPDGSVMVNQGCSSPTECDLSNERWDPATGEFSLIEQAVTVRAFHSTVLHAGSEQVVAVGGCQPGTCSWWNETYDVSNIMRVDAGAPEDAGPRPPDAGARDGGSIDAGAIGVDGGLTPPTEGDCGCNTPGRVRPAGGGALTLLALGLLFVRRR